MSRIYTIFKIEQDMSRIYTIFKISQEESVARGPVPRDRY